MPLTQEEKATWLAEDNQRIVIADISYHDSIEVKTLRVASYPYIMGVGDSTLDPLDGVTVLNNLLYDDIIQSVPTIISRIDTESSLGTISLYNTEGEYDLFLNDYTLVGHSIKIYIGQANWVRDDFITILDGVIGSVSTNTPATFQMGIRDRKGILDVALQPSIIDTSFWDSLMTAVDTSASIVGAIQGTRAYDKALAVLPEGIEDTVVPICLGKCFNIEPVLVDSYNHVYLIHDSPEGIVSVDEVRANGIVLTGSQYEVDIAIGVLRLLDNSQGTQITCDVTGQNGRSASVPGGALALTAYSAAWIIEWLLLEKGSVPFSNISQETFPPSVIDGFDNESVMGFYSKDDTTVLKVVTELINSVGGFLRFRSEDNLINLYKLIDPAGQVVDLSVVADDIIINRFTIKAIEEPKKSITYGYKKNWKTQDEGALAQALTDITSPFYDFDRLDSFKKEYGSLYKVTPITEAEYPLAEDVTQINSSIFNVVDAQTELDRRILLRSIRRRVMRLETVVSLFTYGIGDIVNITHPRYGFENGKNSIIIGIEESPTNKRVTLDVWL